MTYLYLLILIGTPHDRPERLNTLTDCITSGTIQQIAFPTSTWECWRVPAREEDRP
jgi:hypothetical protein